MPLGFERGRHVVTRGRDGREARPATSSDALATGIRRMQAAGSVVETADPVRVATAILAAIQGGLLLSQSEREGRPLEAALDHALGALHVVRTA